MPRMLNSRGQRGLTIQLFVLLAICLQYSVFLVQLIAGEPSGPLSGFAAAREWSDKAGKFRVQASLTYADKNEIQLKQNDGKRLRIHPSKLSDADQAFIKAFLSAESAMVAAPAGADNPFETVSGSAASGSVSPGESSSAEPSPENEEVPVRKFNDKRTMNITMDFSKPFWKAGPVAALRVPVGEDIVYKAPAPKDFHDTIDLKVAGGSPAAFVSVFREGRGSSGYSRLGMMDFRTAEALPIGEYTVPWRITAVTPDATRVALLKVEGWGTGSQLVIATISAGKLKPDFQFRAGGGGDDLAWVAFLNNDRLVTISKHHVFSVWELKENRISYRGPCGDANGSTVGGRGELLAFPKQGRIAIVSGLNFKQVGLIALDRAAVPTVAFSPDGKFLAAYTPYAVDLFRLEDGQLDRSIVVNESNPSLSISWIGENVLLDNRLLVDCKRGIPLWTYRNGAHAKAAWAGQLFSLFPGEEGSIVATRLPHPGAERAAEEITAERLYILRKGSEIELTTNLQGLEPANELAAAQAVRRKLHELGWKLVDNSDNQVHLELKEGDEQESEYGTSNSPFPHPFSRTSGPLEKVRYRPWIHTITVTIKGEEIFRTQQVVSSPYAMTVREGESTQQAVNRFVRPSVDFFRNVALPAEILRPEYRSGLGTSDITATGIN